MKKKRLIIIIFFAGLCALVFFNRSFVAQKLAVLLSYPESFFSNVVFSAKKPFEILLGARATYNDNQELKKENQELLSQIAKLKEYESENRFLREEFSNKTIKDYLLSVADIIGISRGYAGEFVIINMGSADGIKMNMPVVLNGRVLVGKVSDVFGSSSKVSTIFDEKSKIAAKTQETEIPGVVYYTDGSLRFEIVGKDKTPKIGEMVATSALDGAYPKGFIVGRIKEGEVSDQQTAKKADMEAFFSPDQIERVFVITNFVNDFNKQ
jgi:rod shape-determining protein MreC